MENSSRYSSLGIVFSAPKSQLWWGPGHEKTSLTSLFFKGGKRSRIHVQSQHCTVGGARRIFCPWGRNLCPLWYCVAALVSWDWHCRGKEDFLGGGGGEWTLAADLLDDFGQNCFCIEWPCDGAVRGQSVSTCTHSFRVTSVPLLGPSGTNAWVDHVQDLHIDVFNNQSA